MSAFLAALRISRRDALRAKGRSALIMVMIGLPVLVITGLFTAFFTTGITQREGLSGRLGAADAQIMTNSVHGLVRQDAEGVMWAQGTGPTPAHPWTTAEIGALLGGGRQIPYDIGSVEILTPDGYDMVSALELDLRDPMTGGIRRLTEGRLPAAPGEIAVTPALLDRGLRLGETVKVTRSDRLVRVVGVVEQPYRPKAAEAVSLRGVLLLDKRDGAGSGWLADTPAPLQWQDVLRLNQSGLRVASRAVIESPDQPTTIFQSGSQGIEGPLWIAIIVVLVVLETVLLAGPAFAVGLRRRRGELAMIAAQGGSAGHLRVVVLADGLVLGGAASLIGLVAGVGGALLVVPAVSGWTGLAGPPEVPWWQVVGVAALGLVSGVVAALIPAVQAARQHPAQVLAGRRPVPVAGARERAGRPMLGLALVVLGLGLTVLAVNGSMLAVVAAAVLVVFGLVALMPWLVRATAERAGRLPLPVRLSVRDAARHRTRTASAAAAVMAATMAAVVAGIASSSGAATHKATYHPSAPVGSMAIVARGLDDAGWAKLRTAAAQRLKGVRLVPALEPRDERGRLVGLMVMEDCQQGCSSGAMAGNEVTIGDERVLALLQGRRDPQAAAALAAGKAVVFDQGLLRDGMLRLEPFSFGGDTDMKDLRVPAVAVRGAETRQGGAVLPAAAVRALGFETKERRLYAMHAPADELRLERDLTAVSGEADLYVEKAYQDDFAPLWLLLGGVLILVLGGTFAATGLAAADMRADLNTLAAVGGPPRTRRLVVAAQAGYIAGLGALVGLVAGAVSGIALVFPLTRVGDGLAPGPTTIDVPWLFLAGVVVGLPLLAALVAGLFTRTRLVLARRVA
jgi:putative ABC transport system permease protein